MTFKVSHTSGFARRGTLTTKTTSIETPVFMPVGTYGTVKGLTPKQLKYYDRLVDLRVDYSSDPVADLRRLYQLYLEGP
jgi:tRNA-guanine family transglycosylase